MSASVAVAKTAATVASDKRGRTAILSIIAGILMLLFLPVIILSSVLDDISSTQFDINEVYQIIDTNMSQETKEKLQHVNDVTENISKEFAGRGFDALTIKKAQAVYACAFYDTEKADSSFANKLAGCYERASEENDLPEILSDTFDKEIDKDDFSNLMSIIKINVIDISNISPDKTNIGLVEWANFAYENGWGYVWGSYGNVLTENQLQQYISISGSRVSDKEEYIRSHWMGRRTSDCVGLIKGYGWYNSDTGKIEYGTNGMPDLSANGMHNAAIEKGPMSTMPEIPGLAVWQEGHIGIYIGNGYVIQAANTFDGVIKTKLSYNRWQEWLKVPYINYEEGETV